MAPNPRILWGPTYENELVFAHPPYSPVGDREPREGSEWQQGASGTEDAWITGRDYTLDFDARFLEHDQSGVGTPLTGPMGWQAFLDACRDKQPFRFVPDEALPEFYVPGCQLVEPMRGFGEMRDYRRGVHLKIRNPTVDFIQALRGLMFEYAPGGSLTDPVVATFARATAATYRGKPGSLAAAVGASAASGVLRDRHYEGSLRTTLLEAARTQLVTQPENLGHADWVVQLSVTRTGGQADPFGGTAAYLLDSATPSAVDGIYTVVDFTGDGEKAVALFLRQGSATVQQLILHDETAAATRHILSVTWSGGVPALATTAGTDPGVAFAPVPFGGGWWLLMFSTEGVIGANENRVYLRPDFQGNGGTVYAFGVNAWDAPFPSSYQGPSLGTRNVDAFSFPITAKPQPAFFYVKFVERGTARIAVNARGGHGTVGSGSSVAAKSSVFHVYEYDAPNHNYSFYHRLPTQDRAASVSANSLQIGDVVELLGLLYPNGSVNLKMSVNGAADISGSQSSASTEPIQPAWGTDRIYLGSYGTDPDLGAEATVAVKVGPLTFGGVTVDTIPKARAA